MSLAVLIAFCVLTIAAVSGPLVLRFAREMESQRVAGLAVAATGLLAIATLVCSPAVAQDSSQDSSQADNKIVVEAEDEGELSDTELEEIEATLKKALADSNSEISLESHESLAELVTTDQPEWMTISAEESLIRHQQVVASKLYFTSQETETDLDDAMADAVSRYVNNYLGESNASLLIRHDADFIRNNLMREQFDEVWNVTQFDRKMYRRHVLLDFNDNFRSRLDHEWRDVVQTSKVLTTGLGAFGLLGLMGVVFAYLRLDTATKGYYSGRLQFLAAAAILALSAAGVLFANVNADWLRWM
jgi:hypothetical protein